VRVATAPPHWWSDRDRGRPDLREWAVIAGIMVVAASLRLIWLDVYPPGLFFDPAGEGLDAQRIQAGERPAFLPANNGREPLLNYLMAAVFEVTGPTLFGLRLAPALIGIAGVLATYAWARAWFGRRVGLVCAALMAVSMWHVFLSRFGVRAILLPLVEPLAVLLLWQAVRGGSVVLALLAGSAIGVAAYSYLPIRLFPVILAVVAVLAVRRREARVTSRAAIGVIVVATMVAVAWLLPLALYFLDDPHQLLARSNQVSLLSDPGATTKIAWSALSTLGMLVWAGDPYPFTNVPGWPVFDPLISVAFVVGLVLLVRRLRDGTAAIALGWIVLMLIPGMLTVDAPNSQRTAGAMPAVFIPAAVGLVWIGDEVARLVVGARRRAGWAWASIGAVAGAIGLAGAITWFGYFVALARVPNLWEWYETDVAEMGRFARDLPADRTVLAILPSLPDVGRSERRHNTLDFLSGRRIYAFDAETFAVPAPSAGGSTLLMSDQSIVPWRAVFGDAPTEVVVDPWSGRALTIAHPADRDNAPAPLLAQWDNGLVLSSATFAEAASGDLALLLSWAPMEVEVNARGALTLVDGDGRERDMGRVALRGVRCPRAVCGEIGLIVRVVWPSPPANARRPHSYRLRIIGPDGAALPASDADGRRIGTTVRIGERR
jgi:hypothetical protein